MSNLDKVLNDFKAGKFVVVTDDVYFFNQNSVTTHADH